MFIFSHFRVWGLNVSIQRNVSSLYTLDSSICRSRIIFIEYFLILVFIFLVLNANYIDKDEKHVLRRLVQTISLEARWPSGRARGRGFDPHSGHRVVSLSKIHLPPKKVLVIPRKRWLRPEMTE